MASPQAINFNGITTAELMLLTVDQAIKVGVNSTTALWPVSKMVMLEGAITAVYVKNENTSREATVRFTLVD